MDLHSVILFYVSAGMCIYLHLFDFNYLLLTIVLKRFTKKITNNDFFHF